MSIYIKIFGHLRINKYSNQTNLCGANIADVNRSVRSFYDKTHQRWAVNVFIYSKAITRKVAVLLLAFYYSITRDDGP